jgi:hypothetical protein
VECNGKNSSFEDRAFKINKHSKILISQFTQKFCSEHFVHLNGFSRDQKKTIIARPGIRAKAQPTKAIRPFHTQHQPSSLGIQLGQSRTQVGLFFYQILKRYIYRPNYALVQIWLSQLKCTVPHFVTLYTKKKTKKESSKKFKKLWPFVSAFILDNTYWDP